MIHLDPSDICSLLQEWPLGQKVHRGVQKHHQNYSLNTGRSVRR